MTKESQVQDLLKNKENKLKWLVLLLSVFLYANTLNHSFALDDYSVIIEHSHVQAGTNGIQKILTTNYRNGQQGFNDGLYRPLSLVMFAIEKSWFNSNTTIAHLINVLLYGASCLLLFLSFQRVFSKYALVIPLGITLLFMAHPIHTEIVANIKGRDELLAFFGLSLSLYSFLRLKENKSYLILALAGFILALFSKENAVIFAFFIPGLMLLNDDKSWKEIQLILLMTLPLVIIFVMWRNHIINSMENPVDPGNFGILNNPIAATEDLSLRWGSTFALQWTFLTKLLFPFELIHDYSYHQLPLVRLFSLTSLFGILVYLSLGVFSILGIIKRNKWGLICSLYLLSIGVASQIFLPIGIQFAERMLFMAVLPFSIFILFLLRKLLMGKKSYFDLKQQKNLLYLVIIITAVYSIKTFSRNQDWKNNYSLYNADIENASSSARANYNLGTTLSEQADLSSNAGQKQQLLLQATEYLRRAADIYPEYLDAWNNLGIAYKKLGNFSASVDVYRQNIERDPTYSKNYYNLGTAYYQMGEFRKAIQAMSEYTSRVPNSPDAYMLMAQAAGRINSFGEAVSLLNSYLLYRPNDANAYNMLGMAYGSLNQFMDADQSFQKAIQLDPNRADILFNRAINFNRQGFTAKEITSLKKVLEIQGNHQAALRQLVSLLESSGNLEEASKYRARLQ